MLYPLETYVNVNNNNVNVNVNVNTNLCKVLASVPTLALAPPVVPTTLAVMIAKRLHSVGILPLSPRHLSPR